MTLLNSRQYAIWLEAVKVFNVEPQSTEQPVPSLSGFVQPVVDVLSSLAPGQVSSDTIAAAAVDSKAFTTVPEDEYWMVMRMSVQRDSGDRDLDHVFMESGQTGNRLALSNTNVSAVAGLPELIIPVPVALFLAPSSAILMRDSGGTTNSAWTLFMYRRVFPVPR